TLYYSDYLDDGIFELRTKQGSNIVRSLYFFFVGSKIIITHGFRKKTPPEEIEKAKKYRADYLVRNLHAR
ncbi:MAG: type II toxin-antitoxin system RelE/ParE family toxin, partial [Treponema lecithinolyticum]|uniref:type II toxin-antitoxin system RelE/ParE family toxin n=1 Tax=Treponema lecithinolyticum TaxID=53418 RepID=UPI003616209A